MRVGRHAYETLYDPFSTQQQTLNGFYIVDPWYGETGASGLPGWPTASPWGFPWGSTGYYFTISAWNSTIFKADTNDGSFWNNQYTTVLRASTNANPGNQPPETYGDYVYQQTIGAIPASLSTTASLASPDLATTVGGAVSDGLTQNGLEHGGKLGVDLAGYTLGSTMHVASLVADIPSYELTGVYVGPTLVAVAMTTDTPGGYSFAGLTTSTDWYRLETSPDLPSFLHSKGLAGSPRFVWAWTAGGELPFAPFIEAADAGTGSIGYYTAQGRLSRLELTPGQ